MLFDSSQFQVSPVHRKVSANTPMRQLHFCRSGKDKALLPIGIEKATHCNLQLPGIYVSHQRSTIEQILEHLADAHFQPRLGLDILHHAPVKKMLQHNRQVLHILPAVIQVLCGRPLAKTVIVKHGIQAERTPAAGKEFILELQVFADPYAFGEGETLVRINHHPRLSIEKTLVMITSVAA